MDKFCPIYPLQEHDEDHLDFQNKISTFEIQQQQYIIQENLITNHALPSSFDVGSFLNYNSVEHGSGEFHQPTFVDNNLSKNNRQDRSGSSATGNVDFESNDNKQKKTRHKEIERQRRQQMGNLYASLKSLLPLESLKGRRSTSDFILEAENHIRLKKKNIEELTIQKDNLTKWSKSINATSSSSLPSSYLPVDISVRSHLSGMEIFITTDLRMEEFQLSRVLELVLAEGLSIVSCVSTRVKGKMLHTIQTEVSHLEVTDACELKQKLFDVVNDVPNFEQLHD